MTQQAYHIHIILHQRECMDEMFHSHTHLTVLLVDFCFCCCFCCCKEKPRQTTSIYSNTIRQMAAFIFCYQQRWLPRRSDQRSELIYRGSFEEIYFKEMQGSGGKCKRPQKSARISLILKLSLWSARLWNREEQSARLITHVFFSS